MSLRATLWAYDDAPVEKPTETLVLIALADEANDQGRNAFPSVAKVAARARCQPRAAKYALRALEASGLIRRGDQEIATRHIRRADRRPTVYDLAMEVTWESRGMVRPGSEVPPERGAQDAPRLERGASERSDGVHESAERGARERQNGVHSGAPDPCTNPTQDPTQDPSGAASAASTKRGTRLPDDWEPSSDLKDWFRADRSLHVIDAVAETAKFVDYWRAVTGHRGTKLDWDATWRNWIRNATERATTGRGAAQRPRASAEHRETATSHF